MRGGGLTPNRPKTFARSPTLPEETTNVSIHDKGRDTPAKLGYPGPVGCVVRLVGP
jgi:hypothetical protein